MDLESFAALSPDARRGKLAQAENTLKDAGADFVIEDISHLVPVVHEIARRIAAP
jgi:phosphonoacetaldehyde hydrolase